VFAVNGKSSTADASSCHIALGKQHIWCAIEFQWKQKEGPTKWSSGSNFDIFPSARYNTKAEGLAGPTCSRRRPVISWQQ
jgi:hypothetical protein